MSTTPPHSLAQPNQPPPETPKRSGSAARSVPKNTPSSRGSAARMKQEGDTDRVEGYKRGDYDDYIREDLNSRVFVDFEVFLKSVLHVPHDWKTLWGPAIEAVKADEKFISHHKQYADLCGDNSTLERSFYTPLMETADAVLDVVSQPEFKDFSGTPQRYHVNDPKRLRGGVINWTNLSPDLVVLHKDCSHSEDNKAKGTEPEDTEPKETNPKDTKFKSPKPPGRFHWANALHILEVKPYDNAICDGTMIPRLIVDGIDPILNHAPPPTPKRYKSSESDPTAMPESTSTNKRRSDGATAGSQPVSKKARKESTTKSTLVRIDEEGCSVPATETKAQANPAVQVGCYLLEMFSVPLLRSHATVCLVDRDRLQLYHANRSVILVSSAINFSKGDGLDQFIAVIIAFHCLSLDQNGLLHTFAKDNIKLVKNPNISSDDTAIQKGNQLVIKEAGSKKEITVTLGDVISRDPATIGRSTVVLKATSDHWPNMNLVVKVSWPSTGRVAESKFLEKAIEEAKKTEEGWATKHLPQMLWTDDFVFGEKSTFGSVANLFKDAKFQEGKKFVYEPRALRIIIQEELHPLKSLGSVKEIGQVFVDVACIHRWLHDHPGILHRDLSLYNIMCRIIEGMNEQGEQERKVYGVLTDYDLSSWTEDLKNDYTKTSQQRTGTPPYMAHELLNGASATHLYRHDLESLFYIMLLLCGRHTLGYMQGKDRRGPSRVVMRGEDRPYQDWFDQQNYITLGNLKSLFFSRSQAIKLSPSFRDFYPWLYNIRSKFARGFSLKTVYEVHLDWDHEEHGGSAEGMAPFDDETLDGRIDYPSFIELVPRLEGELEGLVIRYNPKAIPPPTSD